MDNGSKNDCFLGSNLRSEIKKPENRPRKTKIILVKLEATLILSESSSFSFLLLPLFLLYLFFLLNTNGRKKGTEKKAFKKYTILNKKRKEIFGN